MKQWRRVADVHGKHCGHCGLLIPQGEPIQAIRGSGHWTLYRGQCCAGAAPPDLPRDRRAEPAPDRPPVRLRPLAEIAADWKLRQALET